MMAADQTTFSGERPLSKGALFALACAAGGTILLFYLFAAITVILLLVVLACELVFVVAAARFGLAAPMAIAPLAASILASTTNWAFSPALVMVLCATFAFVASFRMKRHRQEAIGVKMGNESLLQERK